MIQYIYTQKQWIKFTWESKIGQLLRLTSSASSTFVESNVFSKQFLWAPLLRKHYCGVFLMKQKIRRCNLSSKGVTKVYAMENSNIALCSWIKMGKMLIQVGMGTRRASWPIPSSTQHQQALFRSDCTGICQALFWKMSWTESRQPLLSLLQCLAALVRGVFLMSSLLLHFMTPQL